MIAFANPTSDSTKHDRLSAIARRWYDPPAEPPPGDAGGYLYDTVGPPPVDDNADGLLTHRTDGAATEYVWDGQNMLSDRGSGDPRVYTYKPGDVFAALLSSHQGTVSYATIYDAQQTLQALALSSGSAQSYRILAFGGYVISNTPYIPFAWGGNVGYYTDPTTGLVYVRDRWYDPATGKWLNPDRIDDDVVNRRRYARNRPTWTTDPSGLFEFVIITPPYVNGTAKVVVSGIAPNEGAICLLVDDDLKWTTPSTPGTAAGMSFDYNWLDQQTPGSIVVRSQTTEKLIYYSPRQVEYNASASKLSYGLAENLGVHLLVGDAIGQYTAFSIPAHDNGVQMPDNFGVWNKHIQVVISFLFNQEAGHGLGHARIQDAPKAVRERITITREELKLKVYPEIGSSTDPKKIQPRSETNVVVTLPVADMWYVDAGGLVKPSFTINAVLNITTGHGGTPSFSRNLRYGLPGSFILSPD